MHFGRYGVMTTNITEVYNWIIRGLHGLPLVAIVEGMLYDIIGYYHKKHATAIIHYTTMHTSYANRMMAHLQNKNEKAVEYMVHSMGIND